MTTTVELERAGTFEPITYGDFEIENGTSDVRLAPEATITTANSVPVESNQRVRIVIDGVTRFSGRTTSEGTRRRNGQRRVRAEHEAYRVFDEAVSVGPTSDAATVLQDAIAATSFAAGLSVTYTGTSETLTEAYEVTDRKVKSIFRDIVDRTNRVWWVAADGTITVQPRGGRGEWTSVSLPGDDAAIDSYEAGDVRSVLNDVTVVGTGEERVEGNATDAASISEYGRRSETFNLQYVTTASEADAAAAELLQPTPLDSASVIVGGSVGTDPDQNLANFTISLSDNSFDLAGDSFIIESQSIEQGRVTLEVGEAATNGIDSVNRASKSRADGFEGDQLSKVGGNLDDIDDGTNFGRILQSAIDNGRHTLQEAVGDLDNIEDGGQFARVNTGNVDANNNVLLATSVGDLDDIDDGSEFGKVNTTAISAGDILLAQAVGDLDDIEDGTDFGKVDITNITPGGAVFASGVDLSDGRTVDDITATDSDKGGATVIDGDEILTGSIQANEIDTLVLDTDQLKVGFETNTELEFTEENSTGDTALIPETDEGGFIGTPFRRFNTVNSLAVGAENVTASDQLTCNGQTNFNPGFGESVEITEDGTTNSVVSNTVAGGTGLRPDADNVGALGSSVAAWSSVSAHNFITATPEPLSGVSCRDVTGYDWHNPPEVVAQTKASDSDTREYKRQNPNDGVEVGHMTNWLLEVTKDQQRVIESLESTIDDLESRLAALESQVGPNA